MPSFDAGWFRLLNLMGGGQGPAVAWSCLLNAWYVSAQVHPGGSGSVVIASFQNNHSLHPAPVSSALILDSLLVNKPECAG